MFQGEVDILYDVFTKLENYKLFKTQEIYVKIL